MATGKVTLKKVGSDGHHPEYDVFLDGKRIGLVYRRHTHNDGYFGCWAVSGGAWTTTRKEAVAALVASKTKVDA